MRDPERAWRRLLSVVVMCVAASAGAAGGAAADVVTEWNEIAQRTVASVNPLLQSRSMAIVQASVADAVGAVLGEYEPIVSRPAVLEARAADGGNGTASTTRTAEITNAARVWIISGMQGRNPVARQVSVARRLTLAQNARLLALLNVAMADALGRRVGEHVCRTTARPLGGRPGECAP